MYGRLEEDLRSTDSFDMSDKKTKISRSSKIAVDSEFDRVDIDNSEVNMKNGEVNMKNGEVNMGNGEFNIGNGKENVENYAVNIDNGGQKMGNGQINMGTNEMDLGNGELMKTADESLSSNGNHDVGLSNGCKHYDLAIDAEDNVKNSEVNLDNVEQYKVYKSRWFMLFVVCCLNLSNAMMWITFAAAADTTITFYGITSLQLNMLSMTFMFATVPLGFVASWVLDTFGLRTSLLISAWLNGIGGLLRNISTLDVIPAGHAYTVLLIGQVLAACAQPFVMFAPTKLAALWFPENRRATANMIGSMMNPLGNMVAFIIVPLVVEDVSDIPLALWIVSAPAFFIAIVTTVGVRRSRPPTPPSPSAGEITQPFKDGLKQIIVNKNYMILNIGFGAGLALFTALASFLEQILCPRGYSDGEMSLTDKGVKKGRLYSCIHCEKAGKSYREARYRVVGHILKHHLSLDQTPYYCSLCMFRCLTADALQKHVTGYKRHQLMAEGEQVNNSNFLVQNKLARPICEGTDYRQLSLREQFSSSTSAEDPLNRTDEFLLNDFDALDEQVQAEFHSSAVNRDLVNNSTSGQSLNQVGAQGLINVQVTPDVLAQLMQQKQVNQPQQAQTQVNQGSQMFIPPPPIQRQLQVPLAPHTQTSGSLLNMLQVPGQSNYNNHNNNSSSSTPLLDELRNTVFSFPTPDRTTTKQRKQTPKSSKLNTPKGSPPEDIMNQLLGDLPDSPAFSALEPGQVGKQNHSVPIIITSTKSVQTEPLLEPEPKRQRRDEDPEGRKALLETLGKITAAIDWNSRAIRNQDRTISQVVNVLSNLEKSVSSIADGLKRKDSYNRGKENLDSPNRKVLKSIVKKK